MAYLKMTNRIFSIFIIPLYYAFFLGYCLFYSTIVIVALALLCGYTIGISLYFERKLENPKPLDNYPIITIVTLLFSLVAWIYYYNVQPHAAVFLMFLPFIYIFIYIKMSKNWELEELNKYRATVSAIVVKDDVGGMFDGMIKPPSYENGVFYGSFAYNSQTYNFKIDVPLNTYLTSVIGDEVVIEISKRDPTMHRYHSMIHVRTIIDPKKLDISQISPD